VARHQVDDDVDHLRAKYLPKPGLPDNIFSYQKIRTARRIIFTPTKPGCQMDYFHSKIRIEYILDGLGIEKAGIFNGHI
jgi:hypothetical protein